MELAFKCSTYAARENCNYKLCVKRSEICIH